MSLDMKPKRDWREINIQNRMGRCVHFTGLMGPGMERRETCAAGVRYDSVRVSHEPMEYQDSSGTTYKSSVSDPCIAKYNHCGAMCAKRETMTREQAEAEEVRLHESVVAMGVARKAIVEHVKTTGKNSGSISCPTCKTGSLGYSRATSNGHVWARCSTEGCHAWME